ncbi:hypothetical protein ColKHC_00284 [Colletotrichum higginsianum]|nr:hypothetical protein ColKHC_00284 [Colletotrichum higginsianum]
MFRTAGNETEFRKRRQAAEASRRQRVQRLENVVEDMSVLFIDLFDQILRDEQVVKHCPQLLGVFQSSARRLKTLVEPVTDAEDGDAGSTGEPLGFNILEAAAGYRHAEERAKGGHAMPPDPRSTLDKDDQDKPSNPATASKRPLSRERAIALSPIMTGLDQSVFPGVTPPPANTIIDTFSLQLLETTLSQACLVLDGYLPVPPEEVQRIFGTALQFQTQEQVLYHLRWLLASDLGQKQAAAKMPWGAMFEDHLDTPQHAMQSLGSGQSASPGSASDHANAAHSPPGFLTAVDIQERLRGLGARQSGPDTLELRISGETGHGTSPGDSGPELERSSPPSAAGRGGSFSNLTLHVNVSLLLVNLVQSATCFIAGPAYTQIGFSKAVERSVVLLDDSDFSALSSNP